MTALRMLGCCRGKAMWAVTGGTGMKLGVVFPTNEIGTDPGGIRAYAQAVQDLGYEYLLAFDHVPGADPAGL